jgi:hypothetical protein
MDHHACGAQDIETREGGAGRTVALCVFHLIAGIAAGLIAIGAVATFAGLR